MDAYRSGEEFVVQFDLPGVSADSIDLDGERNVLTVKVERKYELGDVEVQVSERLSGVFTRQLFLGDTLDTDRIQANSDAGVLTLRIPIAEQTKPRKISISGRHRRQTDQRLKLVHPPRRLRGRCPGSPGPAARWRRAGRP